VPETPHGESIGEVPAVRDQDAIEAGRGLAREAGIPAGISPGANAWAACTLARRPEYAGKTIVTVLPDTGERYVSTELFTE